MLRYALISQIVQMLIMELSILQISYSSEMELEDDSPPASSPRMDRLSMRSESPETDVRCKISVPNPANSVRNS